MLLSHYLRPLSVAVIAALSASHLSAAQCSSDAANCKIYNGDGQGLSATKDFGYLSGKESSSQNQVIINSGNGLTGIVRGAASNTATRISDNAVIVELSSTDALRASQHHSIGDGPYIAGASVRYSGSTTHSRNLTNNSVTLRGAEDASFSGTKATISGGSISGAYITYQTSETESQDLTLANNRVVLDNVRYEYDKSVAHQDNYIGGAHVEVSPKAGIIKADGNAVDIQNSIVEANNISAARVETQLSSSAKATAIGNSVRITNSEVTLNVQNKNASSDPIGRIVGVSLARGDAEDNIVEVSESTLTFELNSEFGSLAAVTRTNNANDSASSGNAHRNGLKLHNVQLATKNQGYFDFNAAQVVNGDARENFIEITGQSKLTFDSTARIYAVNYRRNDSTNAAVHTLSNNRVLIRGVDSDNRVDLSLNDVIITTVYNGTVGNLALNGNTVNIENAVIGKETPSYGQISAVNHSDKGTATNNTVTIANSEVNVTDITAVQLGKSSESSATDNAVVIGQNVSSTGNNHLVLQRLYGGRINYSMTTATEFNQAFSGNSLSLASRVETGVLQGFQHYNFRFDSDFLNSSSTPYVTVTGNTAVLLHKDEATEKSSTVTLSGVTNFQKGQEVVLIDSKKGFVEADGTLFQEGSLDWLKRDFTSTSLLSLVRTQTTFVSAEDYQLGIENNQDGDGQSLVLVWEKDPSNPDQPGTNPGEPENPVTPPEGSVNDQTDTLVESSLSAFATAFAADDLFVDTVLRSRDGKRDGLFAAARAGMYSYDTNTRLETNIVNGLVGFSASLGQSNVGAFLEMGHASYDSQLNSTLGNVRGQGSHNYAGLGVFVDYALPAEGWRLTGYLKGGSLHNGFSAMIAGVNAGYDKSSAYWGAHLGTHYDINMPGLTTRVFFSYFYDGRESESYDIGGTADVGGAHIEYDALNAHRVQAGSIFQFKMSDRLRPYLGLTFEQILAAEAKGTATDAVGKLDLRSSDLEGSTGILSAGWTYINEPGTFSCEFGLNGYAGTRNGVSGQIQGTWRF